MAAKKQAPPPEVPVVLVRDAGMGDGSMSVTDVGDDLRALQLGVDSAGGYAVPVQLDGTKKPKK